jgi:pimeloyl-ACP methyl ester carboxylesterase
MAETPKDPISALHASFSERRIPVSEDVRLRVVSWHPKTDDVGCPVVFVAGWVSIVAGWAPFLDALTRRHPVYYIETREKRSAEISRKRLRPEDFCMERFAQDLITVCSELPIDLDETIVSGSSLGATVLLEAMKNERLKAKGAFLVGPATEFRVPHALRWMPYLLPSHTYHLVKHFIVWYFRRFRVDAKKEPEQMSRYEKTIFSAHPLRIKLSGRAFMHYEVWPDLYTVGTPARIAYAATDKLHAPDAMTRLARTIRRADLLPCKSNKYMHDAPMAEDIIRFFADLQDPQPLPGAPDGAGSTREPQTGRGRREPVVAPLEG